MAGNVAFKYTRMRSAGERTGLDLEISDLKRRGKLGINRWVPIKTLVVVQSGSEATVTVPAGQRRWLRLLYTGKARTGVRLFPCSKENTPEGLKRECEWKPYLACRSGWTQFNGAVLINFSRAPRSGRCAGLKVSSSGKRRSVVYLYAPRSFCK